MLCATRKPRLTEEWLTRHAEPLLKRVHDGLAQVGANQEALALQEVEATRSALHLSIIVSVSLALAMACSAIWRAWHQSGRITEPLLRLSGAAKSLALTGTTEAISSNDEIGELTRTFNHMKDSLSAKEAELRASKATSRVRLEPSASHRC